MNNFKIGQIVLLKNDDCMSASKGANAKILSINKKIQLIVLADGPRLLPGFCPETMYRLTGLQLAGLPSRWPFLQSRNHGCGRFRGLLQFLLMLLLRTAEINPLTGFLLHGN